ncbi:hypothetical protein G4G93_35020 [Methylobacterium sp. DB0501]|uniref:hypothetical protein n=1 Tax=Methylobacterium sp. DB0501 TaxID=2709665 RepID=UPI0013E9EEA4|nr:hypothetical protein [Methylobacterium sp. DB0501]NGM39031.1 hypothetical protein [Methylobacterium sp. DB0501]
MSNTLKPGQTAPRSGQYQIVGPRGGQTPHGERTVTKDEPMPPTPAAGQRYVLVDPTDNGAGRGRR